MNIAIESIVIPIIAFISIILIIVIMTHKDVKCKYYKDCEYYDPNGVVCNKEGGMYSMGGTRGAGCFREKEEEMEK